MHTVWFEERARWSTDRCKQRQQDADPSDGRNETLDERMDRNWNEMLQELRVTQTGTQILTGFLLAIAFQNRFAELRPSSTGST